jgi:thioredoxin 1
MRSWFPNNWTGLAFVIAVGIGVAVVYSDFTPVRPFGSATQPAVANSSNGGRSMSPHIQTSIVYANELSFRSEVLQSRVPVLVDFYADWCGPCRALGPILEELAEETKDAKIVKVNVDESPQLASQYGVSSIPSLLVFKDGRIVARQTGLAGKQQLKALLDV